MNDEDGNDAPRELVEPTTGRPILMAPRRQQRPHLTGPGTAAAGCPFCRGHERETPSEIDAVRPGAAPGGRPADGAIGGAAWTVRAFANKYPAARHHEVIAEGGEHADQPGDLGPAIWRDAVVLWQRRIRALEGRDDVGCAFWFKNVGMLAGASIAHNHSQLLGLAELPPRLQLERQRAAALGACPWCATLQTAGAEGRIVAAGPHHVALTPDPPKLPYETWLLPRRCDDDFLATDPAALGAVLHQLFERVRDALRRPAFNVWLHRVPTGGLHWHFELQPRTGQLAGLELGGDMYINSVPAADAAAVLRGDATPHTGRPRGVGGR